VGLSGALFFDLPTIYPERNLGTPTIYPERNFFDLPTIYPERSRNFFLILANRAGKAEYAVRFSPFSCGFAIV
jgi:hypothetical protein